VPQQINGLKVIECAQVLKHRPQARAAAGLDSLHPRPRRHGRVRVCRDQHVLRREPRTQKPTSPQAERKKARGTKEKLKENQETD
jgi:hypothetical protein